LSRAEVRIPERDLAPHENRSEDGAFRHVNPGDVSNVEALTAGEDVGPEEENEKGQECDSEEVG
jgi:hypothetical protein